MATLSTRKAEVGRVLKLRKIESVSAQVGLAVDASGSMKSLYEGGTVQDVVERFLALGLSMDRDRKLDVWPFDTRTAAMPAVTEADFAGYVGRVIRFREWGGGTLYLPPLRAAHGAWFPAAEPAADPVAATGGGFLARLFGRGAPAAPPSPPPPLAAGAEPCLLFVITDGDNQRDDEGPTRDFLEGLERARVPFYVTFVGIGSGATFRFVREVAEERGNVGFLTVPDLGRIRDPELYERVVTPELAGWLRDVG